MNKLDNVTRLENEANRLAAKWATKYRNAMRNAELEYYIFQAILEASRTEYSKGYNDCALQKMKEYKHA